MEAMDRPGLGLGRGRGSGGDREVLRELARVRERERRRAGRELALLAERRLRELRADDRVLLELHGGRLGGSVAPAAATSGTATAAATAAARIDVSATRFLIGTPCSGGSSQLTTRGFP